MVTEELGLRVKKKPGTMIVYQRWVEISFNEFLTKNLLNLPGTQIVVKVTWDRGWAFDTFLSRRACLHLIGNGSLRE